MSGSMPTPMAKRRRLENAYITLSKPFRTPLLTQSKSQQACPSAGPTLTRTPAPICSPELNNSRHPSATKTVRNGGTSISFLQTDSVASALQQQLRQLEAQLIALRYEVDTFTQARSILSAHKSDELEGLIIKWKRASREAADAMFASVKDRVTRTGGVGAWREREKRSRSLQEQWEREDRDAERRKAKSRQCRERKALEGRMKQATDEKILDDSEEDSTAEEEVDDDFEQHEEESDPSVGTIREVREHVCKDHEDDDTYTMEMMLRTLHIDLKLVGWSSDLQQWLD